MDFSTFAKAQLIFIVIDRQIRPHGVPLQGGRLVDSDLALPQGPEGVVLVEIADVVQHPHLQAVLARRHVVHLGHGAQVVREVGTGAEVVRIGHAGGCPQGTLSSLLLLSAVVLDVEVQANAGHAADDEADDGGDDQVEDPQMTGVGGAGVVVVVVAVAVAPGVLWWWWWWWWWRW